MKSFKYGDYIEANTWWNRSKYYYRIEPVPGVRKTKKMWHRWKYPKTYQEKKKACIQDLEKEYGKLVRKKRNTNNLVDAWDDNIRTNFTNKSWKNNKKRKKQYWR